MSCWEGLVDDNIVISLVLFVISAFLLHYFSSSSLSHLHLILGNYCSFLRFFLNFVSSFPCCILSFLCFIPSFFYLRNYAGSPCPSLPDDLVPLWSLRDPTSDYRVVVIILIWPAVTP